MPSNRRRAAVAAVLSRDDVRGRKSEPHAAHPRVSCVERGQELGVTPPNRRRAAARAAMLCKSVSRSRAPPSASRSRAPPTPACKAWARARAWTPRRPTADAPQPCMRAAALCYSVSPSRAPSTLACRARARVEPHVARLRRRSSAATTREVVNQSSAPPSSREARGQGPGLHAA